MVMNLRPSMTQRSIIVLKLKEQDRGFEEGEKGGTGSEGREGKGNYDTE